MLKNLFMVNLFNCKDDKNASLVIRTAHCFGAAGVHFFGSHIQGFSNIGHGDTAKAYRHIPVTASIGTDIPEIKGGKLVGIELVDDSIALPEFIHPPSCSYVFGPENGSLTPDLLARCDAVVKIPTRLCLNLSMAAAIVLYDRFAKYHKPRKVG